ncbi:hypothetical protein AAFF_G00138210 [Aldrovandia affinis]|uniref:Uncharacterized protein n=1 Tax=Aldrovandia affinis TaxID=143900 RepID=A0AAD7TBW6_9TELE|nr:hypothetical protein AAFF_G00138210 [Aldrovandia affinis]
MDKLVMSAVNERVITSGDNAYLLPDVKENALASVGKVFLTWSPQTGTVSVNSACRGTLLRKRSLASKESDFKKLMSECVGLLSVISPPEICAFAPTGCGGLLLLLSSGWISWLQKDGVLRKVYKLADNCLASCRVHSSMSVYGDVLVLAAERTLYVIDIHCGLELEKITLKREGVLFTNSKEQHTPHLLSEAGLFAIRPGEPDSDGKLPVHSESLRPGSVLVEAVFEEACRYYQQRSLSSNQLTGLPERPEDQRPGA